MTENKITQEPIKKFAEWFDKAKADAAVKDHTEMCLATASKEGKPSARIVLLKAFDDRGFVFYTNYTGRKSEELNDNPFAALTFYWPSLGKQIRIEGKVEKVSAEESNEYFMTRPRESRIGAWTSKQSKPLANYNEFLRELDGTVKKFDGKEVTRPEFWGGWRVVPERIEFWKAEEFRFHQRDVYEKTGKGQGKNGWEKHMLYP